MKTFLLVAATVLLAPASLTAAVLAQYDFSSDYTNSAPVAEHAPGGTDSRAYLYQEPITSSHAILQRILRAVRKANSCILMRDALTYDLQRE